MQIMPKKHRVDGKVITLCKTLRENPKIPRENYDKIRENVRATLELSSLDEVTEELIEKLASTAQKPFGEEYVRYGKRVVDRVVKSPEELVAFVQRWRRTFIDEMKPKFLPDSWSINASVFVEEQESD